MSDDEIICEQFVELITDYFEGTLEPRSESQIEEHLVMCDWCTTYAEQMELTVAALGTLSETAVPEPPESILAALRTRKAPGS